jgi:hypothetical protein
MPRSIPLVVIAAGAVALAASLLTGAQPAGGGARPANNVIAAQVAYELGGPRPPGGKAPMSGGVITAALEALGTPGSAAGSRAAGTDRGGGDDAAAVSQRNTQGCSNVFQGDPDNVRVNQDCSLRRQAEEVVVVNPTNFANVIAGQNDSRIGFNHCGYDWTFDHGKSWGDSGTAPPPFWNELLEDGHTADACSDPSATFDHLGNAYVTGIFFDIASPANALFVAKSNAPIGGSFYHSPFPLAFQEYRTTPMGQIGSTADPDIANDKELMIADSRPTSPKKGRVYVTWTRFEANGTAVGGRSPIVFSQSTDGGANWSPPTIISGAAGSFCTVFSGTPDSPNSCDQDQGSHPVVGPDGTIYVIFGNGNTPLPGINQVLMVKCLPTSTCNLPTDWLGPFRVGDLIGTHPTGLPGNPYGCPTGRQCLPPNGYRVPEFTSMSISVDRQSRLYATWADHRNGRAPCLGTIPPAAPPCNHDVFYAYSVDGGVTWSPTIDVTSKLGNTAQYQPWHDVLGDGSKVFVAFYDRHYGNCEFTGCNDITLAVLRNPRSATPDIAFKRITTSSMPNLTPATNPVQAGFIGDYMWVEVSRHSFEQTNVHIVWADTRPLPGRPSTQCAPEEDIYYAVLDGKGDGGEGDRGSNGNDKGTDNGNDGSRGGDNGSRCGQSGGGR